MADLLALSELEDRELVPEILPVDARLSIASQATVLTSLFSSAYDVTPAKEVIPYTSYTRLEALEGLMRVSASDGERFIFVESPVVIVKLTGNVLLPGKRILDILKLVPEETVRIDVIGTSATIRSGRAVWKVETPPVDASFPAAAILNELQWLPIDRTSLVEALELILPAVSRTTARQSLMQAEIAKSILTSCDGARAHRVKIDLPKSFKTTMPLRFIESAIKELKSSSEETVYLWSNHSTVGLKHGSNKLFSQRLNFDYPPVNHLVLGPALSNEERLIVNRRDLIDVIRRVRVSADPEFAAIFLSIREIGGQWLLTVSARDKSGNASQEILPASYDGPAILKDITLNHRYFLEFLACIHTEEAELRLGESTKLKQAPVYYESEEFTGAIMVMAPNFVR